MMRLARASRTSPAGFPSMAERLMTAAHGLSRRKVDEGAPGVFRRESFRGFQGPGRKASPVSGRMAADGVRPDIPSVKETAQNLAPPRGVAEFPPERTGGVPLRG
jgi:hypothetical protein